MGVANKYKNKYRIESSRLRSWDYGWNALYFVTICAKNRQSFFGNIIDHKIILSDIGKMAEKYWNEIPAHFPFVQLHNHIVMPNHVHGIIQINKTNDIQTAHSSMVVETQNIASLPEPKPPSRNKFGPQSQNLASIIRGFKIGVTKNARQINPDFAWQPRFHDHIIRNNKSYQNISDYIINNPFKWDGDSLNPKKQGVT